MIQYLFSYSTSDEIKKKSSHHANIDNVVSEYYSDKKSGTGMA